MSSTAYFLSETKAAEDNRPDSPVRLKWFVPMKTHRFARIRRFHFNLPQRIAAGLLLIFLAQCLWLCGHQTLTDSDYQYARCGREMWERPGAVAGYFTSCGNIHDGVLAYRLAGLPLSLNLLAERGLDLFRKPEDRVVQPGVPALAVPLSTWELRHQLTHVLFLLRLPFVMVGLVLAAGLWWITRRLFGNFGGYTALALYCFSPAALRASVTPNAEILSALALYGGIYTCIGVAHAMQGPKRKWRPRILLLTVIFGVAAASHLIALPIVALVGMALMLWIAEGRRQQILPVILIAAAGSMVFLLACYAFSPNAMSFLFRAQNILLSLSLEPAHRFFASLPNAGTTVAVAAAFLLYLGVRRSRYFGNTAPLLCALALLPLVMTGTSGSPTLWALPFLLTFIGGVFADAYETVQGRWAIAAAGSIVLLQVVFCIFCLPGLL